MRRPTVFFSASSITFVLVALAFPVSAGAEEAVGSGETSLRTSVPMPRVYAPVRPREVRPKYPWREKITTTIFWVGEQPTERNPTPNNKSSWDTAWERNYGGFDNPAPEARAYDFRPKDFEPGLNPFYIALPYNDLVNYRMTKPEARRYIPWFKDRFERNGRSVCRSQWVAIRYGKKICYAQWEDCGPWTTDDPEYVFGGQRPQNKENNGAGLDVSPAVRDYLGIRSGVQCDWRFVDKDEVPPGPWRRYGSNNHFVKQQGEADQETLARFDELRRKREEWLKSQYGSGGSSGGSSSGGSSGG